MYFREFYDSLLFTHSKRSAKKKAMEIANMTSSLKENPYRGSIEDELEYLNIGHRYIIYEVTKRNKLKIIYFIDESDPSVHITDFFPCSMKPSKMRNR